MFKKKSLKSPSKKLKKKKEYEILPSIPPSHNEIQSNVSFCEKEALKHN